MVWTISGSTACTLGVLLGIGLPLVEFASQGRYSQQEIRDAISLGVKSTPAPYELVRTEKTGTSTLVGSVYPPLLRLAMWAHSRRMFAAEYQPWLDDIPHELLEPVVVIAIHEQPFCCPAIAEEAPRKVCAVLVPTSSDDLFPCEEATSNSRLPEWATGDTTLLRRFDKRTAERSSALIAFKLTDVDNGWSLIYEQHRREQNGTAIVHLVGKGTIRKEDLVFWR